MKKRKIILQLIVILSFSVLSISSCGIQTTQEELPFSENVNNFLENMHVVSKWSKNEYIIGNQDSDCYKNYLCSYTRDGTLTIFNMQNNEKIAENIVLENSSNPHCNTVSFSNVFYSENDLFPLIYVNAYNNLPIGTFYAVRIINEPDGIFRQKIIQTISIAFVDDQEMWPNYLETRPYGNFVVDHSDNSLISFVPDERIHKTRIYKFNLPSIVCEKVSLEKKDIIEYFEIPLIQYPQGAYLICKKLIILSGFGTDEQPGYLYTLDINKKIIEAKLILKSLLFFEEPESVFSYHNKLYIAHGNGSMYI